MTRKRKPDFLDTVRAVREKLAERGVTIDAAEWTRCQILESAADHLTDAANQLTRAADLAPPDRAVELRVLAAEASLLAARVEREEGK